MAAALYLDGSGSDSVERDGSGTADSRVGGWGGVKIAAITAAADASQRDGVMRAGFDDFTPKPFRQTEVFFCMARQLGLRYSSSEEAGHQSDREGWGAFGLSFASQVEISNEVAISEATRCGSQPDGSVQETAIPKLNFRGPSPISNPLIASCQLR